MNSIIHLKDELLSFYLEFPLVCVGAVCSRVVKSEVFREMAALAFRITLHLRLFVPLGISGEFQGVS